MQLFSKAIQNQFKQLDLFHQQTSLFDPQPGQEKEFAEGDRRKLQMAKNGKLRWMNADADSMAADLNKKFTDYVGALDETEFCLTARQYRAYKGLEFSGGTTKIQSPADAAYLFKQLREEAIEHAFAVHVNKDGDAVVQHLGTGKFDESVVDRQALISMAKDFESKEIYFVHNHPSGNLQPSRDDAYVLGLMQSEFSGTDTTLKGIIVDTLENKFTEFNPQQGFTTDLIAEAPEQERSYPVLAFSKQYFYADISINKKILHPDDVAGYIQASRFSSGEVYQLLTLNIANKVIGRFNLTKMKYSYDQASLDEIAWLTLHSGGSGCILMSGEERLPGEALRDKLKHYSVNLLDYIRISPEKRKFTSMEANGFSYDIPAGNDSPTGQDYSNAAEPATSYNTTRKGYAKFDANTASPEELRKIPVEDLTFSDKKKLYPRLIEAYKKAKEELSALWKNQGKGGEWFIPEAATFLPAKFFHYPVSKAENKELYDKIQAAKGRYEALKSVYDKIYDNLLVEIDDKGKISVNCDNEFDCGSYEKGVAFLQKLEPSLYEAFMKDKSRPSTGLFGKSVVIFGKSLKPTMPSVSKAPATQPGQEKPGHKYVKRERDQKHPGKYIYYYKMPNGQIEASNDANGPDKSPAAPDNAVPGNTAHDTQAENFTQDQGDGQQQTQNNDQQQGAAQDPAAAAEAKKNADDPDYVDYARIKKVYGLRQPEIQVIENLATDYMRKAKFQKGRFLEDVDAICEEGGIKGVLPSIRFGEFAVKGKGSIFDKALRNIAKGRPEKNYEFSDILRTTIVINSPKQAKKLRSLLEKKGYEFLEDENLYDSTTPGYKHIAWKVRRGKDDPLVKEILLMRPNMLEAKFGLGHGLYDVEKHIIKLMPKIERHKDLAGFLTGVKEILGSHMSQFYEDAYYRDLEEEGGAALDDHAGSTVKEPSSRSSYSTETDPSETNATSNSSSLPSAAKDLSSSTMTSLMGFLNDMWQPISANLSTSSGVSPRRSAKAAKIDSIFSFIVEPLGKLHKKYSQNIINKSTRFKRFFSTKVK
jgi:hypothetical protein